MAEHSAVNRMVAGSSPTRGVLQKQVFAKPVNRDICGFLRINNERKDEEKQIVCLKKRQVTVNRKKK